MDWLDEVRIKLKRRKPFYWNEHVGEYEGEWADFMLK